MVTTTTIADLRVGEDTVAGSVKAVAPLGALRETTPSLRSIRRKPAVAPATHPLRVGPRGDTRGRPMGSEPSGPTRQSVIEPACLQALRALGPTGDPTQAAIKPGLTPPTSPTSREETLN